MSRRKVLLLALGLFLRTTATCDNLHSAQIKIKKSESHVAKCHNNGARISLTFLELGGVLSHDDFLAVLSSGDNCLTPESLSEVEEKLRRLSSPYLPLCVKNCKKDTPYERFFSLSDFDSDAPGSEAPKQPLCVLLFCSDGVGSCTAKVDVQWVSVSEILPRNSTTLFAGTTALGQVKVTNVGENKDPAKTRSCAYFADLVCVDSNGKEAKCSCSKAVFGTSSVKLTLVAEEPLSSDRVGPFYLKATVPDGYGGATRMGPTKIGQIVSRIRNNFLFWALVELAIGAFLAVKIRERFRVSQAEKNILESDAAVLKVG